MAVALALEEEGEINPLDLDDIWSDGVPTRNGRVLSAKRLAYWAAHSEDWAKYLMEGGGDEETWWLYRKMKGLPGYDVSKWRGVYESRGVDVESLKTKSGLQTFMRMP